MAQDVEPPELSGRAADAARGLFIAAAIGSFTSPALANIAAALGLIAFFSKSGALARLRDSAARPLGVGILLFLGTMAAATLWADAPWERRFAAWWSWRPLILVLVGSILFTQDQWKDRFARVLVMVLSVAAVASFIVRMLPIAPLIDDPGVILRNHTTQGMAFVVGTLLAAMLAWRRPVSARERQLLLVAIALFIANIAFVSTGRSAHLALLVAGSLGTFFLFTDNRRWWMPALVLLLGGVILASSAMVRERFAVALGEVQTANTSAAETSMGLRVIIWSTTRDLIAARPLLGYGVGGFAPAYAQLIHQRYSGWQAAEAKDTHNQYLHVMVEAGVPGILAFIAYLAGLVRQRAPAPYRGAALALLAAWLATSLFNSHFETFAEGHLLGIVLGVLLAGDTTAVADQSSMAATVAATSS